MKYVLGACLLVAGWLVVNGCNSSNPEAVCVPGTSQSCAGQGDCAGFQVCNAEGSAFEPCNCDAGSSVGGAASTNAGSSGDGANGGGEAGESSEVSATSDAGSGGAGSNDVTANATSTTANSSGPATANTGGAVNTDGGTTTDGADTTSTTDGGGGDRGTGGSPSTASTTGVSCAEPPTVFVLVDASSSMWDNLYWDNLRDAVLGAVDELDGEVRFGLATFTGTADTCPLDLQTVGSIELDNHQTLSDFYTAIGAPGGASETPTAAAVHQTRQLLAGESGQRAILLVTDGNPDFCDNGVPYCRADALVRVIQDTRTLGIDVLVAALPDPLLNPDWLTAYANAGVGQPVSSPEDTQFCTAIPAPTAAVLSDIDPNSWPLAEYGAEMGSAAAVTLAADDVSDMTASLVTAISGWSSCD